MSEVFENGGLPGVTKGKIVRMTKLDEEGHKIEDIPGMVGAEVSVDLNMTLCPATAATRFQQVIDDFREQCRHRDEQRALREAAWDEPDSPGTLGIVPLAPWAQRILDDLITQREEAMREEYDRGFSSSRELFEQHVMTRPIDEWSDCAARWTPEEGWL